MTDDNPTSPSPSVGQYARTENFISTYANSVMFESNAWDLKIIFGQIDTGDLIKQHLAVSIPWAQAKLMLYWLRLQVEMMESTVGKIPIRKDLIPPEPVPPPEEANKPETKKLLELIQKYREEFIASL